MKLFIFKWTETHTIAKEFENEQAARLWWEMASHEEIAANTDRAEFYDLEVSEGQPAQEYTDAENERDNQAKYAHACGYVD